MGKLDKSISETISLYIIGGGAMSFYDLKTATKDIDVLVNSEEEAKYLINALESCNYGKMENIGTNYQKMRARAVLENTDRFRWDIFVNKVCGGLSFSKDMASRAKLFKNLKKIAIYLVSPEDIFIFKSVTSRPRDREDMFILFSHGLDVNIVKKEIMQQSIRDESRAWLAYFFVGLDELVEEYKVIFPDYDEFCIMAEKEMIERLTLEFVKKKPCTLDNLVSLLGCKQKDITKILNQLLKKGLITKKDGMYILSKSMN